MSLKRRVATAVATGFYLSYIPVKLAQMLPADKEHNASARRWTGAGLVGTLLGWVCVFWLPENPVNFLGFLILTVGVACWASDEAERELQHHDDPRIIIDEVVGYWVTVAFLPRHLGILAIGFIFFRVLDSIKLPPYRWLERLPGGYGVVADDVGAGIFSHLMLRALLWVHG